MSWFGVAGGKSDVAAPPDRAAVREHSKEVLEVRAMLDMYKAPPSKPMRARTKNHGFSGRGNLVWLIFCCPGDWVNCQKMNEDFVSFSK